MCARSCVKLLLLSVAIAKVRYCQAQDIQVVKFYKASCDEVNPKFFAKNHTCSLKAINRDKSVVDHEGWLIRPLKNVSVHAQVFRFYSQFRPFLINFTINYCQLMTKQISRSYYVKMFLRNIVNRTNILHECPLSGYLYSKGIWMDPNYLKLRIPDGRYLARFAFFESYPLELVGITSFYVDVYDKRPNQTERGRTLPRKKKL